MTERRPMHWRPCGGCEGLGAHRRWCPVDVGETAAYFGQLSETAEALGDRIGPNDTEAANTAWYLAARLRNRAEEEREQTPADRLAAMRQWAEETQKPWEPPTDPDSDPVIKGPGPMA